MGTGSRLAARLASVVTTAVDQPVIAIVEYSYEHDGQLIVPAGTKPLAGFAASAAKAAVEKLEDYFDIPYPYDKLDLIAAPQYPGAMENAAIILYGAR